MVELRVLGAVEVVAGGTRFDVGPARQRDVLAVLLLEVGRAVPADRLVDRVWGDRPPRQPRNSLYAYVSRLRAVLGGLDGVAIERDRDGYVLLADPLAMDVHRFESLLRRARTTADDHAALALYDEALALWRGTPLSELDSPWVDSVRSELERKRETAVLDRDDLRLRTGAHAAVLARPAPAGVTGERAAAQRIEALFLDGRPADALREYEKVRLHLADELGTDPGPRLRGLHERILTGAGPEPRQLPAAPPSFSGRTGELAALDRMLAAEGAVAVISGPGGLGKTWLAVRWATDHASRFPDGQLYADLRGFDPIHEPVPAERALRGFLGALGVAAASISPEPDGQVALYRSLTARRRLLVVLDNARDTGHVTPLLPGGSSCSVLVTSRHELGGLRTTHGASALPLRTLDEGQARELLAHKLGAARLAEEPEAAREVVRQCGGMSLALAIVAARVCSGPGRRLSALAAELRESRLDALDTGELTASLRAVFDASYRSLDPGSAAAFRLLGLVPADDVDRAAATALLGDARPLRVLCAAHLLEEHLPGRFRMHDLVKLHAAELAARTDDPATRLAASTRLFDHYLCRASAAMDLFSPHEPYVRPRPDGPCPGFADARAARAWLDAERATMLASATSAPEALAGHVIRLSATLWRYLYVAAHHHEALTLHTTALALTRPGTPERGFAAHAVGKALILLGSFDEAAERLGEALALASDQRNDLLESMVRNSIATIDDIRGHRTAAREQYGLALAAARRTGHALLEGIALCNIGEHYRWCADHETAVEYLQHSGRIAQEIGSAGLGGPVLSALGSAYAGLGRPEEADDHFRRALELARVGRNTNLEVSTLNDLAATKKGTEAIELYEKALALARRTGHLRERALAHHGLGVMHRAAGDLTEATAHLEAALVAYAELRAPEAEEVRVLLGRHDPAGRPDS
ncbi:BTAD domain-containing putative transcriptional regulator [Amycolatopsis sp. A133]|uniref:AfsR/SARP family transcriptional regulator n=1 Tax=Amycolatopsis sp. A133 TaxID=3064472 RepID=UPI0027E8128D|nr:BTAD domain-containing putative transcriptional regulator [Amycolatopsis sp. A133]MDQ7802825.1 BTAD domain-containing putative transcriptional regulator [Amycolatopsis sp. A133]